MTNAKRIGVTGATGKLGAHVIDLLLEAKVPASAIVALVRDPAKAKAASAAGVSVRRADYDDPGPLVDALAGVEKLLLVSSNEVGRRASQHHAVVDAAKQAGVAHVVYTSILRAPTSGLLLAGEHKATEDLIRTSGIPFTFLRNGWYTENFTESLAPALAHGVIAGSSAQGKFSAAPRSDYAAAAVTVLLGAGGEHLGKAYELAGDGGFTKRDLAREVARLSGKTVAYQDLPPSEYAKLLESVGLPPAFANILADSDAGAARGELEDTSGNLRRLMGRSTTPLETVVAASLR